VAVITDEARDPYQAPKDADEFERMDGPRIRNLLYKKLEGLRHEDRADAAADIMEKLVLKQIWSQYGDVESQHTGKRVTWKYYVNQLAVRYCIGKMEQYGKKFSREPMMVDRPAGDGTSTWGELFGPRHEDTYLPDEDDPFERMRDYVALHPSRPAPLSTLQLLDHMAEWARSGESTSVYAVAKRLDLTHAEAKAVMASLRGALAKAVQSKTKIRRFCLGGVEVSAADVQTFIDRLKAQTGNRVAPALKGHPLELAEPRNRWYVTFARQEIKRRPELKIARGTHTNGKTGGWHNNQVKVALIAGLERLLTEAGAPDPELPLSLEERAQAEIWKTGIQLDARQVDELVKAFTRAIG
jgi:hypothetical protein